MPIGQQLIDIFWTVQRGRRFTISLSEEAAWQSLNNNYAFSEDPEGWTVEPTREIVPIAVGTVEEGGGGQKIEIDEQGVSHTPIPYLPVKVFWNCPLCSDLHSNDYYHDPIARTNAVTSPAIWFCEHGKGPVLVSW